MRQLTVLAALSILVAAGAAAPAAIAGDTTAKAERVVYVCDSSELTQRSFERLYGEQKFVTADEAMKAAREDQAWSAPRCMTKAEYERLSGLIAERERTIVLSSRR